jgi:hypothetical protein
MIRTRMGSTIDQKNSRSYMGRYVRYHPVTVTSNDPLSIQKLFSDKLYDKIMKYVELGNCFQKAIAAYLKYCLSIPFVTRSRNSKVSRAVSSCSSLSFLHPSALSSINYTFRSVLCQN